MPLREIGYMEGRVILQDLTTHSYLAKDNSWAESCQRARVFEHTYEAVLEGLEHREKVLQVVWCFQNPAKNMYLPVKAEDSDRIYECVSCPLAHAPVAR
jgi:hypothetical protein